MSKQQEQEEDLAYIPENDEEFKKQLLNRQTFAVGAEAQRKYGETDVLVVGMTGLGLELVKSLVLSGVRKVTMVDDTPISWSDLSSMFYATPEDVGKPRAATLLPKICELNRFVKVTAVPASQALGQGDLVKNEILKDHHIAVFVDKRTTLLQKQNEACRQADCKMICCESRGVACSVFVDAGAKPFHVCDAKGKDPLTLPIINMMEDGSIEVALEKHDMSVGDSFWLSHIKGGESLCSDTTAPNAPKKFFKVKSTSSPFDLIADFDAPSLEAVKEITSGAVYQGGGSLHTVKSEQDLKFLSLEQSLAAPEFAMWMDDCKIGCSGDLLTAFRAIHRVSEKIQSDNVTNAIGDVLAAAKEIGGKFVDEKLVKTVAQCFHGNLSVMATFLGGIAAQEVLKLGSGKYVPVNQWFVFDAREIAEFSPERTSENAGEFAPRNSRYDGQIAVIGATVQQKLLDSKVFLVGAGALGCEHLKNLAMMGVACGEHGHLTVTDNDYVELSNLSRQFLFRVHHAKHKIPKSTAASEAVKVMNKDLKLSALQTKVGADSEETFNLKFWDELTCVITALDNAKAREYVDRRCLISSKPMFESATRGHICTTESFLPKLTEHYGANAGSAQTDDFMLCTIKLFPNGIQHTIQWAKEEFNTEFVGIPTDVNNFIHENETWMAGFKSSPGSQRVALHNIVTQLVKKKPGSWEDCLKWAREKFDISFNHGARYLLEKYPPGCLDEDEMPFWGGGRRQPVPLKFDAENEDHLNFVYSAAALRAVMYNIQYPTKYNTSGGPAEFEKKLVQSTSSLPGLEYKSSIEKEKQQEQKNATAASAGGGGGGSGTKKKEDEIQVVDLLDENYTEKDLPSPSSLTQVKLFVQEFEKDDDSNHHIDFITSASNLRAISYDIPPATRDHTKLVAGKIIPAMITTTATATGMIGIDVLLHYLGCGEQAKYRSSSLNMAAQQTIVAFPPMEPGSPLEYTSCLNKETKKKLGIWDSFRADCAKESQTGSLMNLLVYLKTRFAIMTDAIYVSTGAKTVKEIKLDQESGNLKRPVKDILVEMLGEKRDFATCRIVSDALMEDKIALPEFIIKIK